MQPPTAAVYAVCVCGLCLRPAILVGEACAVRRRSELQQGERTLGCIPRLVCEHVGQGRQF